MSNCFSKISKWKGRLLSTDYQDIHNQAPGQVRGRATGGWPAGRDEWERTSQMGRPKSTGLISCANAGAVVKKTLASELADAFSQHIPAWQAKRNPVFFTRDFWAKQGHLRSRMSNGVLKSRASLLAKGFESTAPAWLAQAQPCIFSLIRVNPAHPWFQK